MNRYGILISTLAVMALLGCTTQTMMNFDDPDSLYEYKIHDMKRPAPPVVTPGQTTALPPSDAIVLFDGTDLSHWENKKGGPAKWKVENEYMEVVRKAGSIVTKQPFGSCQLHIEWATPGKVKGKNQGRGNSGVFLMDQYEIQILDSYKNSTYPDGQAAAAYGQNPPLVNACRPPGQWQSYDIIFHAPKFDGDKLIKPATVTVLHNGVLVQDHWIFTGPTENKQRKKYQPHPDKVPLALQDHGNSTRFRNIWIRELSD